MGPEGTDPLALVPTWVWLCLGRDDDTGFGGGGELGEAVSSACPARGLCEDSGAALGRWAAFIGEFSPPVHYIWGGCSSD